MDRYLFLIASLYFSLIVLYLYVKLPRYRQAMTVLGLALFWTGPLAEYLWYTKDWWHPETITGTLIGPEDFIFSFAHVVIPMFIYKFVFGFDTDGDFRWDTEFLIAGLKRVLMWFFIPFILAGILFSLGLSSVFSTAIGLGLATAILLAQRRDLFPAAIWGSVLMVAITTPAYWLMELLSPGIIAKIWDVSSLSGTALLLTPIEDIAFYVLLGLAMGGSYEYIFGFKLVKKIIGKN